MVVAVAAEVVVAAVVSLMTISGSVEGLRVVVAAVVVAAAVVVSTVSASGKPCVSEDAVLSSGSSFSSADVRVYVMSGIGAAVAAVTRELSYSTPPKSPFAIVLTAADAEEDPEVVEAAVTAPESMPLQDDV